MTCSQLEDGLKYSINRYNASQTRRSRRLQRAGVNTARINWTDLNATTSPGRSHLEQWRSHRLRLSDGRLRNRPSVAVLDVRIVSDAGTLRRLPASVLARTGLKFSNELLPRLSVSGGYYYGDFRNLTTTLNRNITPNGVDPVTACRMDPVQIFNPVTVSSSPSTTRAKPRLRVRPERNVR